MFKFNERNKKLNYGKECQHLLLRTTEFLKRGFSRKENLKKCTLKSKKVKGIFGETFILELVSSAVFALQNRVSEFLFHSRDKRLLSEFLQK